MVYQTEQLLEKKFFDSMISLETDEMTVLWSNDSLTFTFYIGQCWTISNHIGQYLSIFVNIDQYLKGLSTYLAICFSETYWILN